MLLLVNMFQSRRSGAHAGANPWGADSLEWSIESRAPSYNFLHLPTVNGRTPLWTRAPDQPVVTGMRTGILEVLVTTLHHAAPDHRHLLDGPSLWPFLTASAAAIGIIAAIFTPWGVVVGAILTGITLTGWFWPVGQPVPDTSREAGPSAQEAA